MRPLTAHGGGAPAWLTTRPIAHRGLHRHEGGVIENSRAAALAAIAAGYAIECDVQRSADGEAMVFHDFALDRLTGSQGRVAALAAAELETIALRDGAETIPALPAFLDAIGGRTPLVIEIKSGFDGDFSLAARVAGVLASYDGPVAVKSFDPAPLAFLRRRGLARPLGLVAEAAFDAADWPELTAAQRRDLMTLEDFSSVGPDFLSWRVGNLPHATPQLCRAGLGLPVLAWTVRSADDRAKAARYADQIIFEGFEP